MVIDYEIKYFFPGRLFKILKIFERSRGREELIGTDPDIFFHSVQYFILKYFFLGGGIFF